jgi:hypothetical protein
VGVDSVGVDEGELSEGLLPARGGLAFDEVPSCCAFGAAAEAGFLGAGAGSFVFDGADGQPQQFDHRLVVGEVAAVLDDLAELVVQAFSKVDADASLSLACVPVSSELGTHPSRPQLRRIIRRVANQSIYTANESLLAPIRGVLIMTCCGGGALSSLVPWGFASRLR